MWQRLGEGKGWESREKHSRQREQLVQILNVSRTSKRLSAWSRANMGEKGEKWIKWNEMKGQMICQEKIFTFIRKVFISLKGVPLPE